MASAPVTTVFRPDPMCLDPTNIWLYSTRCAQQGASIISSCTVASQGDPAGSTLCQPTFQRATQYSDCPESYTEAGHWFGGGSSEDGEGATTSTFCCPDVHDYSHYGRTFTKSVDGGASDVLFRDHPGCVATSVDVLRSLTVTVTLGNEPGHVTTTTEWADDAVLFVDAVTMTRVQYMDYTAIVSTCFGMDCPARWTPTFATPAETPPLAQYTPPPECRDPDDLWLVTTPCSVVSPFTRYPLTPSWLQCTATELGMPLARDYSHCRLPTPYQTDGTQYTGCPAGYTPAGSQTFQADIDRYRYTRDDYDAMVHTTYCCPDHYDFQIETRVPAPWGQFTTEHEGWAYGVSQWPLPACYATSVPALSGRADVVLRQYWHRDDQDVPHTSLEGEEGPPVTVAWDDERATLFAQARYVSATVFRGTHTCYDEPCHSWMAYYYSDGTRPPLSATAAATAGGDTPDPATGGAAGPAKETTGGSPPGESGAGARPLMSLGRGWLGVIALVVVGLAV